MDALTEIEKNSGLGMARDTRNVKSNQNYATLNGDGELERANAADYQNFQPTPYFN